MKRISTVLLGGLLLFAVSVALMQPDDVGAIPAFARKYNMSCTTCHAPIPRLKAYGDDFAGNGFVLKDKDAPRYFVEAGDQNLNLIRDFPLAVRFEGFIKHHTETDRNVDFSMPYNLKLLSGGSLTRNIAYYFYFFFSERGEVAGIEDAYLMFNDLFGQDLDIYLGQFQVSDPLFKREVRLTYEDYPVYKVKVGDSGLNLAYDRGLMITYGLPTNTDVVLEVLNGSGIDPADFFQTYDHDKYKNFAGRISQDVNKYFRVGGFGYYGKEEKPNSGETQMAKTAFIPNTIQKVQMAGADATLTYKFLELNLQFMERWDENPLFADWKSDEIRTTGGLAELILWPYGDKSRWYGAALFNMIESDLDQHDYQSLTGHFGYLLKTNIRLIAENTYDLENEENRVMVGFVSGF